MRYALVLFLAAAGLANSAIACPVIPCMEQRPKNAFGLPSCADYDLNSALIEALQLGDGSAAVILQQRYKNSDTFAERDRIGAALLGKLRDDSDIWKDLSHRAEDAVRFAPLDDQHPNPELAAWCVERGWDPDEYWRSLFSAFWTISSDRRALPILRRALATDNDDVLSMAIFTLAGQRDEKSLPLIDAALKRHTSSFDLVQLLAGFESAAADAIAKPYLKDDEASREYNEARQGFTTSPPE